MQKRLIVSVTKYRKYFSSGFQNRIRHSNNSLILGLRSLAGQSFVRYGLLTVIVPIYNVERYLYECLESVRTQNYPDIEVLMIDDGSPDGSASIAREFAKKDRRFRLIQKTNGGLGAARNTGIRLAKGKFITFVDSDDAVSYFAYRELVSSVATSGSDFAVGSVERWRGNRRWKDQWVGRVHAKNRRGITLEDLPEVTLDVFAWNKVFKTDFFREVVKEFPEGILYEDQVPTARAYTRAKSFDVLEAVTYYWRVREDGSSITQNKLTERDLGDRIAVAREVSEIYFSSASTNVISTWLQKTAGFDFGHYYRLAHRGSDEYWNELVRLTQSFRKQISPELWKGVDAKERVLAYLISENRKSDVATIVAAQQNYPHGLPTKFEQETIVIDLPRWGVSGSLPPEFGAMDENDTDLVTAITSLHWTEPGILQVEGSAYIRNLPNDAKVSHAALKMHYGDGSTTSTTIETFSFDDDSVNLPRASYVDHARSGFRARIDVNEVLEKHQKVSLGIELSKLGITRRARWAPKLLSDIPQVAASSRPDGVQFLVHTNMVDGITLKKQQRDIETTSLMLDTESRVVSLKVKDVSDELRGFEHLLIRNRAVGVEERVKLIQVARTEYQCSVRLPDIAKTWSDRAETFWEFFALRGGKQTKLPHPDLAKGNNSELERGAIGIAFSANGDLLLSDQPWRLVVDSMTVTEAGIGAVGTLSKAMGVASPRSALVTVHGQEISGEIEHEQQTGRVTIDFKLSRSPEWGKPYVSPTSGVFGLNLLPTHSQGVGSDSVQVFFSNRMYSGHSWQLETSNGFAIVSDVGFRRGVLVKLDRPIRARDWQSAQRYNLLEEQVTGALSQPLEARTVVCMSFSGASVHDNPAPIARELKARGLVEKIIWIADDREFSREIDGELLVPNSRDAIRAMHTAKYLINNAHFPHYFRKRTGQIYVQTWHGTPLKKVGNDVPATSLSNSYRDLMSREAKYWDLLVAQCCTAAEKLRKAFQYEGEMVVAGYPRNDSLFDTDTMARLRSDFRTRAGLNEEQTVVLYAPTWRDNASIGLGANGFEKLDIKRLLDAVGNDARLLLRGHTNTQGFAREIEDQRILDVSGVSDLNSLVAASDMLITDYSSIFFDYQLSNKPIIGFATDLETYAGTLRGMYFDYESVFPGMIATSNDELEKIFRLPPAKADRHSLSEEISTAESGSAAQEVVDKLLSIEDNRKESQGVQVE